MTDIECDQTRVNVFTNVSHFSLWIKTTVDDYYNKTKLLN